MDMPEPTDEEFRQWLDREMAEFRARPLPLFEAMLAAAPAMNTEIVTKTW